MDEQLLKRGQPQPKPRQPREVRERAVRMVEEAAEAAGGDRFGAIARVARLIGVHPATVGRWVVAADIEAGRRTGLTSLERARLRALERENRELRRANEILKAASAFFAAELDRHDQK